MFHAAMLQLGYLLGLYRIAQQAENLGMVRFLVPVHRYPRSLRQFLATFRAVVGVFENQQMRHGICFPNTVCDTISMANMPDGC